MPSQHGLEWEQQPLGGVRPTWSAEPSLEQIERISRQHLDDPAECVVKLYTQGSFNKLYTVDTTTRRWLIRVALPVDPYRKTASEVSTISWIRKKTSIPVPAILAHEASSENVLRFEWSLMDFMPGVVLERRWRTLSWSIKEDLVKQLARYQSELFCKRFQKIGNLYQAGAESYEVGSIVSMTFFWGDRGALKDVDRGPFKNSHDWLLARLNVTIEDQDNILAKSDDKDDIEDAQDSKVVASRLIALLPRIFPPNNEIEPTILFHDDLHEKNILVNNESGNITAVLDWECVSVFPLWMACQPPALLQLNSNPRADEPKRDDYGPYRPEDDYGDAEYSEGKSDDYWMDLLEYERGKLRSVFLSEMERLQPAWLAEYRAGELKRDFELAVLDCCENLARKRVGWWVDAYERGERYSLRESYY